MQPVLRRSVVAGACSSVTAYETAASLGGAPLRSRASSGEPGCAKHPYLCLAGPEFAAAWNTPPVIGVDSSGDSEIQSAAARHPRWPLDAVLAATDQIRLARDLFLSRYTGPLLRVSAHDLYHRSEQFVQTLTEFLQVEAGSRELTSARGILRSLRAVACDMTVQRRSRHL